MKANDVASVKIDPRKVAAIRLVFGVVWAVDAGLKCTPMFYRMLLPTVRGTAAGMPSWLGWWFHFWQNVVSVQPHVTAVMIATTECAIALSLLLGVFLRQIYVFGAVFSLLIWGVGEAFGGPYSSMSTDVGAACIYSIVFVLLFVADGTPSWTCRAKWPRLSQRFSPTETLRGQSGRRQPLANRLAGKG